MTTRHRRESGATAMETVAIVVVAALLVGGVFLTGVPQSVRSSFAQAVCAILGGQDCASAQGPGDADARTPLEQATWGRAVFMGDSFSSGEGVGNYDPATDKTGFNPKNPLTWGNVSIERGPFGLPIIVPDTEKNMCHRSRSSYQAQVFETLQGQGHFAGQDYSSAACSGAVESDLYSNNSGGNGEGPQAQTTPDGPDDAHPYDRIPPDASLITMSMGGNDVGFADVLTNCVTHGMAGSGCMDSEAIRARMASVYGTADTVGTLEAQIARIRQQHPDARIVIMGYPPLFAEKPLTKTVTAYDPLTGQPIQYTLPQWNGSGMTVEQQRWANEQAAQINEHIKQMCADTGVEFVDPTSLFVGPGYDHRIGSDDPWINGLSAGSPSGDWTINSASFHPNQKGHDAQAGLLLQIIREGSK